MTETERKAEVAIVALSALVNADMSLSVPLAAAIGAIRARYPAAPPGAGPSEPPEAAPKHNPPTI